MRLSLPLSPPPAYLPPPLLRMTAPDPHHLLSDLLGSLPTSPRHVLPPYNFTAASLWRQWDGTVLQSTWRPALLNMLVGLLMVLSVRTACAASWPLLTVPSAAHPLIARLVPLGVMWDRLSSLATFVTTFFVAQSLSFWRACYLHAASISSRLSDLSLLLAAAAKRDADGRLTPAARAFLHEAARRMRLFIVLYWSTLVCKYSLLTSDDGLLALEQRGLLLASERALLLAVPASSRVHSAFAWVATTPHAAANRLSQTDASRHAWLERVAALRSAYGQLGKNLAATMPLVYVHLVQTLVDTTLVIAPFALYPRLGAVSVLLCGVLTVFYRGLVDVSKSLLDPFANGGTRFEIEVPAMVRAANEATLRFVTAAEALPPMASVPAEA